MVQGLSKQCAVIQMLKGASRLLALVFRLVCLRECGRFHEPEHKQRGQPVPWARWVRYSVGRASCLCIVGNCHHEWLQPEHEQSGRTLSDVNRISRNDHCRTIEVTRHRTTVILRRSKNNTDLFWNTSNGSASRSEESIFLPFSLTAGCLFTNIQP
jgi:hypothetical protein